MRRETGPRDPEIYDEEIVLPTLSECERGEEAIVGWVPYYDKAAGVRIAWSVLIAAKNPELSRDEIFRIENGDRGDRVEPPFAPDTSEDPES